LTLTAFIWIFIFLHAILMNNFMFHDTGLGTLGNWCLWEYFHYGCSLDQKQK
jgi:hypothetical protein